MIGAPAFEGFPLPTADPLLPVPSAGLAMWLDATRGLTLDGATSRVAAWASRAGGAAAAQATTASMPTTSTLNGLLGVLFDGADDWMSISGLGTVGDAVTLVYVARTGSDAADRVLLDGPAGAMNVYLDPGRTLHVNSEGVTGIAATAAGAVPAGSPAMVAILFDRNGGSGGPWSIRLNRTTVASGTASVAAFSAPTTMLSRNGYALNGLLAEMLVYSRVLSTSEAARVEAYLSAKWGIA